MTTAVVLRCQSGCGAPLNILGRARWRVVCRRCAGWCHPGGHRPGGRSTQLAAPVPAPRPGGRTAAPAHQQCRALRAVRGAGGRAAAAACLRALAVLWMADDRLAKQLLFGQLSGAAPAFVAPGARRCSILNSYSTDTSRPQFPSAALRPFTLGLLGAAA